MDVVRVPPTYFALDLGSAIEQILRDKYERTVDLENGVLLRIWNVRDITGGRVVSGDGAAYYKSKFKLIVFKPELQELVFGRVSEITNFGAFIDIGCTEGMIHISQTMDDYVSFSKSNTLTGKNTKRSLRRGDKCLARIVAISYKADEPKIGLTMRQPGLGKLEWIAEDKRKAKLQVEKGAKVTKKKK